MSRRSLPVATKLVALAFILLSIGSARSADAGDVKPKPEQPTPKPELTPDQVVKVVMEAMQHNDDHDAGLQTVFRFASPANQQATGPFEHFAQMVKGPVYGPMLNCKSIEYGDVQKDAGQAEMEVTITTQEGGKFTYLFGLTKQGEGQYKDCWMTDAVIRTKPPVRPPPPPGPNPAPV